MKKVFFLVLFLLGLFMEGKTQFKLFSWVRYKNTPEDLTPYLQPIGLSLQNLTNPDNTLNELAMTKFSVSQYGVRPIVTLDIETWSHHKDSLTETVNRYVRSIEVFRTLNKHSRIGFYAAPPYQRYSWKNLEKPYSYKHWQEVNDSLKRFADKVDIFFPSAYCRDTSTANWEKYIQANVSEIREKYSKTKPIYFYIDPQYIVKDTVDGVVNHQFIDAVRWKKLLEIIYKYADGAVIWTSNKDINEKIIYWDPNAEWWKATKEFLDEKHLVE